jgi:acyl-CoA reductase-like NAD-dependent aldehyde dehydrogenase
VAEHVYTHGAAHGKRVQALAGAKNSMIVMPDAVLDKAVPNIISSAYGNAWRAVPGRQRARHRRATWPTRWSRGSRRPPPL